MLNQQDVVAQVMAPLWRAMPLLFTIPSCFLALSVALKVFGRVLEGQRGPRALLLAVVLGGTATVTLWWMWRGVLMLGGPLPDGSPYQIEQATLPGQMLVMLDQLPPYSLAVVLYLTAASVPRLLGPSAGRSRRADPL